MDDDVTKLVELETTPAGRSEIFVDVQPSQFSDGYSLVLTPAEALRLAHALIARVSDIRTTPRLAPLPAPTLAAAA